jgi:hypothetical protein
LFKREVLKYKLFHQVQKNTNHSSRSEKITSFPEDLSIVVGGDGKGFNSVPRQFLQPDQKILKNDTNDSELYAVLKI